ncbi:hypothetical protein Tco_0497883 [Tanacetum coccineum]
MVDVPIRHEDPVIQRTSLVDIVISMVTEQSTPTPPPTTTEVQLSEVDHAEAIEEFIQANVINEVKNQLPKLLPKSVSDYVQPKMEITVRDVLQKNPINLFKPSSKPADSSTKYELKNMLYDKMHLKKRRHDDKDKDHSADAEKGKKKRRRKDSEPSKDKDTAGSSKKGKASYQPSKIDKSMNAHETIQEAAIETEELVQENVINAEEQPKDDVAPKQDNSIWFKQDVVIRSETPYPEWHKEPNADDAPEQN